jgi:hypothetical protein
MASERHVVSLRIDALVLGTVNYWFSELELSVSVQDAESLLICSDSPTLLILRIGNQLLFSRESVTILSGIGATQFIPM